MSFCSVDKKVYVVKQQGFVLKAVNPCLENRLETRGRLSCLSCSNNSDSCLLYPYVTPVTWHGFGRALVSTNKQNCKKM